ncbi:MAG: transcription-repair coupling factor [Candidatus Promineifilaceae bacterium]|nr:transcription-repair coupling factor [Candidatus Promineifilaceae bacterium]
MRLSGLLEIFDGLPAYADLLEQLRAGTIPGPLRLMPGGRAPLLARLFVELNRPMLFITARVDAVPIWQQSLEAWLPARCRLFRFPEPTPLPYERGPWSSSSRNRRLTVLARLLDGQHPLLDVSPAPPMIITSARALLHKTMPKRRYIAGTRILKQGQLIDWEKLIEGWRGVGYQPVSVVEAVGQYSRRGGILDIFPVGGAYPARIELFGDEIESIRYFDPSTQRSVDVDLDGPNSVVVPPARELLPMDARELGQRLYDQTPSKNGELPNWKDDLPDLAAGTGSPNLEYYLPLAYGQPGALVDFLPGNALLVVDDLVELAQTAADLHRQARQLAEEQVELPPDYPNPLLTWEALLECRPDLSPFVLGEGEGGQVEIDNGLTELFRPGPNYGGQVRPLLMQLRRTTANEERMLVISRQAQRLSELWWKDRDAASALAPDPEPPLEIVEQLPLPGTVTFVQGSLASGFTLTGKSEADRNATLHVLTDAEVFGWKRPAPRRRLKARPAAPETIFADIAPGDHVVHVEFGIGQFIGLVVRTIGGMEREYLQVNFANTDVLYVPVHNADRLSKWIGPDDHEPRMHRLGEKTWRRSKDKAQKAADELADELLELYAARESIAGHAFAEDGPWQAELEASFPYQETEEQLRAIAAVKSDMERPHPMDRLICGDVGYGKTEVALRAAFKAVMDGKQVAVLVPTTVLAQQHYNTFRERLRPFPVNVEMLSRFRTQAQQEHIVKRLRSGEIDIVIGTHRLFSDDVAFKDLGLLVIDEEQRFGVAHKERLKQLRHEVDVLTTTATPIPRTLYMSLAGVRDISVIDTPPLDRLPVQSFVGEAEETLLRRAILRELDRGGQVFYVHNRVQTIETVRHRLSQLVPEAVIAAAHGRMSERQLEQIMVRFVEGEVDVLLSTTIIESGLDIPNANTLVVDRADRFGLAQLYQLRGRVGRGDRRAYAYFLHPAWHRLTADAQSRLEVIASQTELGAGYDLAMRDLEIRGAGDLLGTRQSGHIASVGFDLYTRMLNQAVKRRRAAKAGRKLPPELPEPVMIDLPLAAYIPTDYVPDAALRLRLYRRMAVLETLLEVDDMAAELADRFGPIPDPVDNLLYQLRVKVLAARANVPAVGSESGQIYIRLPEVEDLSRMQLQKFLGGDIRVSRKGIWLGRDLTTREWQVRLVQALERLESYDFRIPGPVKG